MLKRSHILEGMKINVDNFDFVKSRGEELYKSFAPVKCPYFNEFVYFNAYGLEHLKFKERRVERLPQDQFMRFKLLYLAPLILKRSGTVQGISCRQGFETVRHNNKNTSVAVNRTYYEFVAIEDQIRVRIIIKRINDNDLYFWSIIPFWKGTGEARQLGLGEPEKD